MRLTVIMSVYNGETYVGDAIQSILNQSYQDFKFIITNNASTDDTLSILGSFAAKDQRIQIINNFKPSTYVEGRMLAIKKANTEWFAVMDADDISEPKRLELQMIEIENADDNLIALGTYGYYINEEGKILGKSINRPTDYEGFKKIFQANESLILLDPSAVIHRETFWRAGGYRKECVPAADLDLWYRLAETGGTIRILPEFLLRYRIHRYASSVGKTLLQRKKTHFINYNMRRRRQALTEISLKDYEEQIWSRLKYRIPRLYHDWAMTFYKKAANNYAEKRYIKMFMNLITAFLIKPNFVVKRMLSQKVK